MNIRSYRETDFARVASIYNSTKLEELQWEDESYHLIPLQKDEARMSLFQASTKFVFVTDQIHGFIAHKEQHITFLFVSCQSRGQKIGQQLLDFIIDEIQKPITLTVVKSNVPAQKLYAKYGFVITDTYLGDYNNTDVYVNELQLSSSPEHK